MAPQASRPAKVAAESDRIGFFGKVPTHGDFISEGLDRDLVAVIDDWLRSGLHACADAFPGRWNALFAASPPRRFIVERGVWGGAAYAGILLPNRDRVGRHYPLVLLAQMPHFNEHPRGLYLDDAWFMAAEALAETSLKSDFDISRFTASIKRLRMPKAKDDDQTQPSEGKRSFWWHIDPETRRAQGLLFEGKLTGEQFLKLFEENGEPDETSQAVAEEPAQQAASSRPETAVQPKKPASAPLTPSPAARLVESQVIYSYATHPGTHLGVNADALFVSDAPALFAIADGAGDPNLGLEAARLTTTSLADIVEESNAENLAQRIKSKLGAVNSLLIHRPHAGPNLQAMASVVAAAISTNNLTVIWAGDARAYLVRDGTMRPLTRDHVTVGMKRQLSQCIGLSQQFRPDMVHHEWRAGDRLLLCSYPLVHLLTDRVVAEVLRDTSLGDCANALIQEALIENARDNVSAIAVGHRGGKR